MAWSEKAIDDACRSLWQDHDFMSDEHRAQNQTRLRTALEAAAAVDGDPVDVRTVTAYESGFEAGKDAAAVDGDGPPLSQDEVMKIWREHGGGQYGPCVEHVDMPLSNFSGFIAAIRALKRG